MDSRFNEEKDLISTLETRLEVLPSEHARAPHKDMALRNDERLVRVRPLPQVDRVGEHARLRQSHRRPERPQLPPHPRAQLGRHDRQHAPAVQRPDEEQRAQSFGDLALVGAAGCGGGGT